MPVSTASIISAFRRASPRGAPHERSPARFSFPSDQPRCSTNARPLRRVQISPNGALESPAFHADSSRPPFRPTPIMTVSVSGRKMRVKQRIYSAVRPPARRMPSISSKRSAYKRHVVPAAGPRPGAGNARPCVRAGFSNRTTTTRSTRIDEGDSLIDRPRLEGESARHFSARPRSSEYARRYLLADSRFPRRRCRRGHRQ